ncbi:MAG TPA: hypothetical protein VJK01_02480 [Candidatus Paceibacterota bacterium]
MLGIIKEFKLSDFVKDKFIILMAVLGATANGYLWHYLKVSIDPSNAFATLHFTASFGVDLIGNAVDIYNIYYATLSFSILNLFFARLAYNYDVFSSYILISLIPLLNAVMLFNGYMAVAINS